MFRQYGRYVYDSAVLEEELLRIFGNTPLGDATIRLCIPSFEGTHGEPWIYKTPHHPDYKKDLGERMVRVGLATSAAPTYFKAMPNNGYIKVDGGLWAKNPILNAVTDALTCFDIERNQIRVLSLGCGETSFKVDPARATGGFFQWRYAIKAAMRAHPSMLWDKAICCWGKRTLCVWTRPRRRCPSQWTTIDGR
jgi:patatin-like phospholipase/acyl hydrolase